MRATLAAPRPLVAGISSLARREPFAHTFGVRALTAEAAPAVVDLRSPAPVDDFSSVFGSSASTEPPPQTVPTVPLSESGLSAETVAALQARGITGLFDVQASVLRPALAGRDVFARARTGSGKTLAFALPIVEALLGVEAGGEESGSSGTRPGVSAGRAPRALVLAPTRELAVQVEREFARCAPGLRTLCCYGGTPSGPQIRTLRFGVDVVVGTPGRVQDLMDGGHLTLSAVRTLVLDEADHMLNVGFAKDVEAIMDAAPSPRQTMLFSATMPAWIRQALGRYLTDPVRVDLSGRAGDAGRS
ncbi:DEAD/DEAH box helicase, partial [Helicosporidium sp. ATCC 50920]